MKCMREGIGPSQATRTASVCSNAVHATILLIHPEVMNTVHLKDFLSFGVLMAMASDD